MRKLFHVAMPTLIAVLVFGLSACGGGTSTQSVAATSPTASTPAGTDTGSAGTDTGSSQPTAGSPRSCDPNITVNEHTSCPFAEQVFKAYAHAYGQGGESQAATVTATSPTTGGTHSMSCSVANPLVTCTGARAASVQFPLRAVKLYEAPSGAGPSSPPTTSTAQSAPPPAPPSTSSEDVGSTSHAGDAQFCSTHTCIPNFPDGNGAVVQCADGEYSHSGGLSGACSSHGGEQ